eukprot:SM000006S19479  [mRNA]  locus=s6:988371:991011:+ [translate_table: standard]
MAACPAATAAAATAAAPADVQDGPAAQAGRQAAAAAAQRSIKSRLPLPRPSQKVRPRRGSASISSGKASTSGPPAIVRRLIQDNRACPSEQIRLIATDVDGTLLNSKQELSERTVRALRLAMDQEVQVVIATGKTRGPWVTSVLPRLGISTPGVYLQGLLIYNADGSIAYERTMDEALATAVIKLAQQENLTLIACCGERILCEATNFHTDRLIGYGEPIPEAVGPLLNIVGSLVIHKLLFMSSDNILARLRPEIELVLGDKATIVTALHGMLEVLPAGASKGRGLAQVLADLGIDQGKVMAIGDGENDIEMLKMAGFAVAMGNAVEALKKVAHHVTLTNDNDGLAVAVEQFVLSAGH